MAKAVVPPLRLRNGADGNSKKGVAIDDPVAITLEFLGLDSTYLKYDSVPVAPDDVLTRADIRLANQMIARMSQRVIDGIEARAGAINGALASIPPDATLTAPEEDVPWRGLGMLMRAMGGIPEVGLARATKVLHKKRPALIPILDSVLEKYLRSVDGLRRNGDFALDAVALIHSYKRELDTTGPALRSLQSELTERGIVLTEVRLLDLFLWGYSGIYTPLYLRDGDAEAGSARSAAAAAARRRATTTSAAASAPPSVDKQQQPSSSTTTTVRDHHHLHHPLEQQVEVDVFVDNDDGYLTWLDAHPQGFVLNTGRSPRPDYLILHRATCRTIRGRPTRGGPWTGPYIKVCGDDPLQIAAWAGSATGAAPRKCGICNR